MPGTMHLLENETVNAVIRKFAEEGKLVAAICAAPSVLGAAGLLEGKHATCHPGFEEKRTLSVEEELAAVIEKARSEEHTSELQSPLIISYAVFCLKKKKK